MRKQSAAERRKAGFLSRLADRNKWALFDDPARSLVDLLYPRSCVACDRPVDADASHRFLCPSCSRQLTFARPPNCRTCGYPFFGDAGEDNTCEHCVELVPRFGEGRTAVLLKGPARALVHELKYGRQLHLLSDIREILGAVADPGGFFADALLVPVPLHPRKERERGFNQSLLLAREVAAVTEVRGVVEPLKRVIDTDTQTRLDREARQANLKNAFALKDDSRLNRRERYILVDDVFTTGSTLNTCAAVLRKAGVKKVDVFTFGHG